ncbi:MAG: hypothetical protein HY953_08840 [Candidatus Rokubacteria bacterium]|nr:hypothetical protein [Candidatus Rokubacteria bacterium]
MAESDVHTRITALPALVNADALLLRRGRYLTTTFLVEMDDVQYLVRVVEGRIDSVERGPFLMRPWSFAVRAKAELHGTPPITRITARSPWTSSGFPA